MCISFTPQSQPTDTTTAVFAQVRGLWSRESDSSPCMLHEKWCLHFTQKIAISYKIVHEVQNSKQNLAKPDHTKFQLWLMVLHFSASSRFSSFVKPPALLWPDTYRTHYLRWREGARAQTQSAKIISRQYRFSLSQSQ